MAALVLLTLVIGLFMLGGGDEQTADQLAKQQLQEQQEREQEQRVRAQNNNTPSLVLEGLDGTAGLMVEWLDLMLLMVVVGTILGVLIRMRRLFEL